MRRSLSSREIDALRIGNVGNERTLCKSELRYALRGKPSILAMSIGGAALGHSVLMHGCARYGRYG